MTGPRNAFCDQLHAAKYRGDREDYREAMNRIAGALKDDERHFRASRDLLLDMRFLPAGRVQAAAGSMRIVTPYNCFVSGTLQDSLVDGHGSILGMVTESAATMRKGGGIGYNFGTLRPRGDRIRKLGSASSGPVSFMQIYDANGRAISSSGHRRGAQMGVFPIWHPDIEEFIRCKQPPREADPIIEALKASEPGSDEWTSWYNALQAMLPLTGFNISTGITDDFMRALDSGEAYPLRWGGEVYREVDPNALWEMLMRSTWDWAEPGVLFLDTINRLNNLYYCETIVATNPCGEQPLPPYGACLLGSFNLVRYLIPGNHDHGAGMDFDFDRLVADIAEVVRMMDNVVDRAIYPLFEQEQEAKNKRRMGLGATGLANALEAMGLPYGSPMFLEAEAKILDTIRDEAYRASALLAQEKGSFPMFDCEKYLAGEFVKTLPEDVRDLIRRYGIRNSHLTSIAPTGTISLCADNVSSGIEPVFSYGQERVVKMPDGERVVQVNDYGVDRFGIRGKRSSEVTIDEHLGVLLTAAQRVDSAVSKTLNVPPTTPWEDFKGIYRRVWEGGGKGCTTYQTGGFRAGILKSTDGDEDGAVCTIDPETGVRDCGD